MINKIILKICHFFGFRKNEEHITDITINYPFSIGKVVSVSSYLLNDETLSLEDINNIKEFIYVRFKMDPKLEKRCRNVNQVWVTFYTHSSVTSGGLMKTLFYDGTLFYLSREIKEFKRHIKLKEIGIEN